MAHTTVAVLALALGSVGGAAFDHAAPVDDSEGVEVDVHISPLDDETPTPTPTGPEPTEPEPTSSTDPGGLPPELPSTGVELSLLPLLAGAAVLGGGAALLRSRRRT